MKGDLTCVGGRLMRHDPQDDDPDLETDVGECPDCSGDGCGDWNGDYPEPVSKVGRTPLWFRSEDSDGRDRAPELEHEVTQR